MNLFYACRPEGTKKPLDTSGIQIHFKSVRFDREIKSMDTNHLQSEIARVRSKYPAFGKVFFDHLVGYGDLDEKRYLENFHHFLTYKDYANLYDTIQKHFPNTDKTNRALKTLFKNISFFYPEENFSNVYYFYSGLNFWSAVMVDSGVAIGLDMYLGKDFPYYASVRLSDYELPYRSPEYIPRDVARSFYQSKFETDPSGKTLLHLMIEKGKEMYFIENVLRDKSDAHLMNYTDEQEKWCKDNERLIYNFFIQRNLLYSGQWQEILPFINEGPTTNGMPRESPGNIGTWLGWQIVRSYMKNHSKTTLNQLLHLKYADQDFLRAGNYKP